MSIIIVHGAPGSYKTSTVIPDYIVPALQSGRTVVTNIRGCRKELIEAAFGFKSDSDFFNLEHMPINIWLSSFLWLPRGSLMVVDEAQIQFPLNLRDIVNQGYVIPEGFSELEPLEEGQIAHPKNHEDGWDMHRHYQWDMVFTCPNIAHVNKRLRGVSEVAMYHINQATVLGFFGKGRYLKIQHRAELSSTSRANWTSSTMLKIDKRAFECYDSTTTGMVQDTAAENMAFLSWKLYLVLIVSVCGLIYIFSSSGASSTVALFSGDAATALSGGNKPPPPPPPQQPQSHQPQQPQSHQPQQLPPPVQPPVQPPKLSLPDDLSFCGYSRDGNKYNYRLTSTSSVSTMGGVTSVSYKMFTSADVLALGYSVFYLSSSVIVLARDGVKSYYSCNIAPLVHVSSK